MRRTYLISKWESHEKNLFVIHLMERARARQAGLMNTREWPEERNDRLVRQRQSRVFQHQPISFIYSQRGATRRGNRRARKITDPLLMPMFSFCGPSVSLLATFPTPQARHNSRFHSLGNSAPARIAPGIIHVKSRDVAALDLIENRMRLCTRACVRAHVCTCEHVRATHAAQFQR